MRKPCGVGADCESTIFVRLAKGTEAALQHVLGFRLTFALADAILS